MAAAGARPWRSSGYGLREERDACGIDGEAHGEADDRLRRLGGALDIANQGRRPLVAGGGDDNGGSAREAPTLIPMARRSRATRPFCWARKGGVGVAGGEGDDGDKLEQSSFMARAG